MALMGCRNDLGEVADFETLDQTAAQNMEGATLEYSEMGEPSHRLRAHAMERSSEEEAVWTVSGVSSRIVQWSTRRASSRTRNLC